MAYFLAIITFFTFFIGWIFTVLLLLLYPVLFLGAIWAIFFKGFASLGIRLLIPRMAAGIIVGYVPLLLTAEIWQAVPFLAAWEAWKVCSMIKIPSGLPLALIALALSFGYLLVEVTNTVPDAKKAWARASTIFLIGLTYALGIGLVILDLVANSFQTNVDLGKLTCRPGLVGQIPLEMLWLYAPLALLIGIFVQIIWEEKPITEPL